MVEFFFLSLNLLPTPLHAVPFSCNKQSDPRTTSGPSLTIEVGNPQLWSDDPCASSPRFEIGGDAVRGELEAVFAFRIIIASRLGELAGHGAARSRDESRRRRTASGLVTAARKVMVSRRRGAVAMARCRRRQGRRASRCRRPHFFSFRVREVERGEKKNSIRVCVFLHV